MNKLHQWYIGLSKQIRDSIMISISMIGMISTLFTIFGISLGDCEGFTLWLRIFAVIISFILIYLVAYLILGKMFNDFVKLTIRKTSVSVGYGDIFESPYLRIIGFDSHFDTRVDDIVISKKSLHGQLVLEHGNKDEIVKIVESEANRLGLRKGEDGLYDFPLGTIIRYDSSVDNHTYLLLAMTELNADYEAHTNMAKFEHMLMKMWKEIDRVYAGRDVALPLLGTGITRFDDGPKEKESLLRCMLCTLNSGSVNLNSKVTILMYEKTENIPLYEYKNMFQMLRRK